MKSNLLESLKCSQTDLVTWALFIKLIVSGLSFTDSLAGLGLLIILQAAQVINYNYPRRPDLFAEVDRLSKLDQSMQAKIDALESDVTGLKFGMARR